MLLLLYDIDAHVVIILVAFINHIVDGVFLCCAVVFLPNSDGKYERNKLGGKTG